MERVSRGLSGAIDTSALHLELQSLFNRIVGIIGSAASMDYGTPQRSRTSGLTPARILGQWPGLH